MAAAPLRWVPRETRTQGGSGYPPWVGGGPRGPQKMSQKGKCKAFCDHFATVGGTQGGQGRGVSGDPTKSPACGWGQWEGSLRRTGGLTHGICMDVKPSLCLKKDPAPHLNEEHKNGYSEYSYEWNYL